VDAHVSELVHCANRRKPPIENHARADPIDDAAGRRRCASHRECHGVIAGFARLQMHGVIVVVTLYGPIVFVCSEPVVVLGMIVVAVAVKVQQERLAGGRGQDQSEQDRYCARHNTSVCNQGGIIKRPLFPPPDALSAAYDPRQPNVPSGQRRGEYPALLFGTQPSRSSHGVFQAICLRAGGIRVIVLGVRARQESARCRNRERWLAIAPPVLANEATLLERGVQIRPVRWPWFRRVSPIDIHRDGHANWPRL
jgi:hypothetical protein